MHGIEGWEGRSRFACLRRCAACQQAVRFHWPRPLTNLRGQRTVTPGSITAHTGSGDKHAGAGVPHLGPLAAPYQHVSDIPGTLLSVTCAVQWAAGIRRAGAAGVLMLWVCQQVRVTDMAWRLHIADSAQQHIKQEGRPPREGEGRWLPDLGADVMF
jgi:hypothetical protein